MDRTFTPRLLGCGAQTPGGVRRPFSSGLYHPRQALWATVYLGGLIQNGERKSIGPLPRRLSLPAELAAVVDPECRRSNNSSSRLVGTGWPWRGSIGPPWPSLGRSGRGLCGGRSDLSQHRPAFGGRAAPALRGIGQEGQLPVCRVAALRHL